MCPRMYLMIFLVSQILLIFFLKLTGGGCPWSTAGCGTLWAPTAFHSTAPAQFWWQGAFHYWEQKSTYKDSFLSRQWWVISCFKISQVYSAFQQTSLGLEIVNTDWTKHLYSIPLTVIIRSLESITAQRRLFCM